MGSVRAGPTLRPALAIVLAALLLTAISAAPASASGLSRGDRDDLQRYAADTWHSFDLLVDAHTGLPDDNVTADGTRAGYTSPTNIGAYLWSTLGAREVGLIGRREATARMARTLATLARMERGPGGQFFNWYDPATGARLTTWPADGSPLVPVPLGGRQRLAGRRPDDGRERRARAARARRTRSWRRWTSASSTTRPSGQLRGGAWTEQPPGCKRRRRARCG